MNRSWMSRKPRLPAVDQVFAFAGAVKPPRNRDLPTLGGPFLHRLDPVRQLLVVDLRVYQRHGHVGHAQRFTIAGAREDHVFHAGAAKGLRRLFAQHPTDGIADVGLAAPVGPDNRGDPLAVEAKLGALAERFEALHFDAFEFEQSFYLSFGGVVTILNALYPKVKHPTPSISYASGQCPKMLWALS